MLIVFLWRLNSQEYWFKKQSYKLSMSDFPKLYLATLWAHPCCASQFARLACCCCLSPKFWTGLDYDNTTVVNCLFSRDYFDYSVIHTWGTDKRKAVIGGVTVPQTWLEHLPENGSWIIRIIHLRLARVQSRPPHRHPFSDFFWGEGETVHRLSRTDNPVLKSQADCSFKIKTTLYSTFKLRRITYLTRII